MAPRAGITPAPQPTRTIAPRASFQTVAPLTTIWTPPAQCSDALITIFGGECDNESCSAWPASQITSNWDAAVNLAYWNTDGQMTGTECAPPGSQAVLSFAFSPAAGCPAGYFTATTDSPGNYYSSASYSTAICCPSSYSVATEYNPGIWGCVSTITTHGQKAVVVAYGATVISDYYDGASTYEFWFSTVSTTIINSIPTYPPLLVSADAVPIVVSTTPWSEPTLTNGYNYPSASSLDGYGYSSTKPAQNFHIGPLNMIYSIVVAICAGIFGLVAICCLLCCCGRRNRHYIPPPPPPPPDPRPITPPVYPVPWTLAQYSKMKNEEENRERQRKKRLADALAERQRIEMEKMKLNPEYLYRMKVSMEKERNNEPSYESMFDAGPTYVPPLFRVSTGNTPLGLPSPKLGKLSKPKSFAKPRSPTPPAELPAARITRPAATTGLNSGSRDEEKEMLKAHTAKTPIPSRPESTHLPSKGPRFLVLPDVTNSPTPTSTLTPKPASSGTFTPSPSRSTPPSRSPGARNPRHASPVNDSVSQRSSPLSTMTKSRNARNTLSSPLAGPKLTVNSGGDSLTTPPAVVERGERESSPPDGLDGTRIPLSLALAALLMSEGRLARDSR